MHNLVDTKVHQPNDYRENDGSNHNDNRTAGQFVLSWPRNLMNELVIRFLDIRKQFILIHFKIQI